MSIVFECHELIIKKQKYCERKNDDETPHEEQKTQCNSVKKIVNQCIKSLSKALQFYRVEI